MPVSISKITHKLLPARFLKRAKLLTKLLASLLVCVLVLFAFVSIEPDYNIYLVRSESMKPTINMGDMVITGPPNGPINGVVKPGMVITYKFKDSTVTHRVLSMHGTTIITKGDAVEDPDPWQTDLTAVQGVYLFKIPGIGHMIKFIRSKSGWFLVILLPAAVLVGLLLKDIIKETFRE